ncbi:MAG TPA: lipid-A-disaccharide synthase [Stellaceae bacterium]|jgi:lipid-A-disaccharide synthase|nr:lipid-A-disaccharide synthase [Stellaceae bacterium]
MPADTDVPLIFVIAGEPSGDVLGGALMAALRERTGGAVRFAGIGGEHMAKEGLRSLVPLHELAIMGITEVLPRARQVLQRVRETADTVMAMQPAAVVTIDSSGFTWRIAQRLRERGERVILIHYVAPMVWAWRASKARKIARWYDHLMTLLPFEPPYFTAVGLSCRYVGHPVLESGAERGDGAAFRCRYRIPAEAQVLCLLPGSRRGEVGRLLPIFRQTVEALLRRRPGLVLVLPTIELVADAVGEATRNWPVPVTIVRGVPEKFAAFAASDVALAASGTVLLELAMAELPAVVAYKMNPLTGWLARRLVKSHYVNLVNITLDRLVVPELLLEECTPDRLSLALEDLLGNEAARAAQVAGYRESLVRLGRGGIAPSLRAADDVLAVMRERGITGLVE